MVKIFWRFLKIFLDNAFETQKIISKKLNKDFLFLKIFKKKRIKKNNNYIIILIIFK